jgi:hypothetical protein
MTAAPDLTVLGSGVLQPIEQEAIRWLAQRRADQGIWLREHNATLTVRRLSDDLFDLELHTKVTDPDSSLKLAHPSKRFVHARRVFRVRPRWSDRAASTEHAGARSLFPGGHGGDEAAAPRVATARPTYGATILHGRI